MKSLLLVSQTGTAILHSPSISFGNAPLAKSIPNRIPCLMITSILNTLPRNPCLPRNSSSINPNQILTQPT
ncbi:MFS transporter fmqE [Fusarium oxysporum f. sp. albedinis]|nr:MFS transporter fmqE [Fusarium oxysporum f. sp. albedinis]